MSEIDIPPHERAEKMLAFLRKWSTLNCPNVPAMNVSEYANLLDCPQTSQSILLIDCRPEHERAISIMPVNEGDYMVGEQFSSLSLSTQDDMMQGRVLVAHCTIGMRSGRFLEQMILERIKNSK